MHFSAGNACLYRFGPFEFDRDSGELRKHGLRLRLVGQPVDVLTLLLERRGELVRREELQKRLWPADRFVEFEHGLNAAVMRLREVLGDAADKPRYIETAPRRGYRFIAPLETVESRLANTAALSSLEVSLDRERENIFKRVARRSVDWMSSGAAEKSVSVVPAT
jgi:DNA-binding winged helix-turn-helix (wHTH) protein